MKVKGAVTKWATQALVGSAKMGHKFLKGQTKAIDYIHDASGITTEPQLIMATKNRAWSGHWRRQKEDISRVKLFMCQLRKKAIEAG